MHKLVITPDKDSKLNEYLRKVEEHYFRHLSAFKDTTREINLKMSQDFWNKFKRKFVKEFPFLSSYDIDYEVRYVGGIKFIEVFVYSGVSNNHE